MTMPTVRFGEYDVSRLIIGGNPFRGNSHYSDELNADMWDYHGTGDTVIESWFECEKQGITAMQARGDQFIMDWVDRYREQGGKCHWFVQTASEWKGGDVPDNIHTLAKHGPIGIYHHGSLTDSLWKSGQIEKVREYLKVIRDEGLLVGLGTHMPEVLEYAEEKDWDVDFYMACAYNLSKQDRDSYIVTGKQSEEQYYDEDREIMAAFCRKTDKPCIFFKILAASRKCESPETVREAFQWAFDHIKPNDIVDVGVFQKYGNQIAENAEHVRAVTR
jgi:hypothetical protein